MSEDAIIVEGLSKRYQIGVERRANETLREQLADAALAPIRAVRSFIDRNGQSAPSPKEIDFWALKDVSFAIKQGEIVGIVGRNGAGKSTLLKVLSRITEPTTGRAKMRGRIASLLEVGTGFHPELTGRENIYLNGSILGMAMAEVRRKFDEIVAFAEVEQFLDTPVKRYSSGMYVRLAFGVAAHLEPEILVIDEVLAVGDVQFQTKCLKKMDDVGREGRTVLFVSHNMAAVLQLTTRAIMLENGRVKVDGPTRQVIERYSESGTESGGTFFDVEHLPRRYRGTGSAQILALWFERPMPLFEANEDFAFSLRIRAADSVPALRVSLTIFASDGSPVGSTFGPEFLSISSGETRDAQVILPCPRLAPGKYHCGLAVGKGGPLTGHTDFDVVLDTLPFEVTAEEGSTGTISTWSAGWGSVRFRPLKQAAVVSKATLPHV